MFLLSATLTGLDLPCQHPSSANASHFMFISKIPLVRTHYGSDLVGVFRHKANETIVE